VKFPADSAGSFTFRGTPPRREGKLTSIYHDLVILGGGPAGLTAGLYAARSRLDVVLLEGKACGGQLTTYESVENYPGFPEGIEAEELIQRMVNQATRFGLTIVKDNALSVEIHPDKPEKTVILKDKVIRCKSIIVATGAHARKINVEGEETLTEEGSPTARPVMEPSSKIASFPSSEGEIKPLKKRFI
jgi:thioredoxin reductase (NADPH)